MSTFGNRCESVVRFCLFYGLLTVMGLMGLLVSLITGKKSQAGWPGLLFFIFSTLSLE
jgi:hypothetical protein